MCLWHAAQLERVLAEFELRDAVAMTIGGGGPGAARFAARLLRVSHPMLADRTREVFRRFGFDRALQILQRSGSVVVDRSGVIRYIHRTSNPADALRLDEIRQIIAR